MIIDQLLHIKTISAVLHQKQNVGQEIDEKTRDFLINWYRLPLEHSAQLEHQYIWKYLYGSSIEQVIQGKQKVGHINQLKQSNKCELALMSSLFESENTSFFYFGGQQQAIIKIQSKIFIINPRKTTQLIISNHQRYDFTIILTTSNLQVLISMVQLSQHFHIQTIITSMVVKYKLKHFISLVHQIKRSRLDKIKIYLLRQNQPFLYQGLVWTLIKCFWFQPQYDLIVTNEFNKKQRFLLQSKKINTTKQIFAAFKQNLISESQYNQFIKQHEPIYQRFSQQNRHFNLDSNNHFDYKYLNFVNAKIIKDLLPREREQVWGCCQQLHYEANCVILKSGTILDFLVIPLDGQLLYRQNEKQQTTILKNKGYRQFYGYDLLRGEKEIIDFDLMAITPCNILRISKQNVTFHLYDQLKP